MHIPPQALPPATLRAIIQEFVTRDGTDHSSIENRIESVHRQLMSGTIELHYDSDTGTCNILGSQSEPESP